MEIYEEIQRRLRQLRDSGKTQQEISNESGISQPFISQLLNPKDGVERIKHLELAKLIKLFPNIRLVFGDDARIIGGVTNNKGQVVNVNGDVHGTVDTAGCAETAASFLKRIMESSDFDSDTKVKLFNLLNQKQ